MSYFKPETFGGEANARMLNAIYAAYASNLDSSIKTTNVLPYCRPFMHHQTNSAPALADWITMRYGLEPAGPQALSMHMPAERAHSGNPTLRDELIACFFPEHTSESFAIMSREQVVLTLQLRLIELRVALWRLQNQ